MKRNIHLKFVFVCLLLNLSNSVWAIEILEFKRFMELVKTNHPIAKSAGLKIDEADAIVRKARGGFDPKIGFQQNGKMFGGDEYFNLIGGSISIPTWYGVELKGGYDRTTGLYYNPQDKTPSSGLMYAGLSLSLGKGLLIDERRAILRQAQISGRSNERERIVMLNDLLLDAGKSYWEWYAAFGYFNVYQESTLAAKRRFEAVKSSALLGDRPSIDTLEAFIQYSERLVSLKQYEMDLVNKRLALSLFLWNESSQPLMLSDTVVPMAMDELNVELNNASIDFQFHPLLSVYNFKIDNLKIEKSLKQEQLKPLLNLSYNPLLEASSGFGSLSTNNYKFGLTFNFPLLLRKERGDLKLTKIKIERASLERDYKAAELNAKYRTYSNEFAITLDQLLLYTGTVNDYANLLKAEQSIFESGESSLFMINSRELSYISSQLKLIDLKVKNGKAYLSSLHTLGVLAD